MQPLLSKAALTTAVAATLMLAPIHSAQAVSCTVAPTMSAAVRASLESAASSIGTDVATGNTAAMQAGAVPSLASGFGDIAASVKSVAPSLTGASITVQNLYELHASDLKSSSDDVQFFCSAPSSQLLVTVTLQQLPPAEYAIAIVHATGVPTPEQFAIIFQNSAAATAPPQWKLAGFLMRPLTLNDHSALWFWEQARSLKAKNASLSAYLYYQAAAYLARPADLYTSNNFDKLTAEMASSMPKGLPGDAPMIVHSAAGTSFSVNGLSIDNSLKVLDLRVDATVPQLGDPVESRKSAIDLMHAMLVKYPDLNSAFHGFWVYEKTPSGQTYAVEQPMTALQQ
jgi:hypothetical protein